MNVLAQIIMIREIMNIFFSFILAYATTNRFLSRADPNNKWKRFTYFIFTNNTNCNYVENSFIHFFKFVAVIPKTDTCQFYIISMLCKLILTMRTFQSHFSKHLNVSAHEIFCFLHRNLFFEIEKKKERNGKAKKVCLSKKHNRNT